MTSVALFDGNRCVAAARREAPRAASAAVIELLRPLLAQQGVALSDITGFVSDVGPGSFTGVKVGLTMVKMWGYALDKPVAGVSAFDLVHADSDVAIPSKRGEVYLRRVVEPGVVHAIHEVELPVEGYSELSEAMTYPDASRIDASRLQWVTAIELAAAYVGNPSISQAKRPHIMGGSVHVDG